MEKKDIRQERRVYRIVKSIELGDSAGKYCITLGIENKGLVDLQNIIVREVIPSNFNLTEFTLTGIGNYEIVQIGDQSEIFVNITEIKANSSVVITYNLSGSGDFDKSEPVVIILGKDEQNL